MADYVLNNSCEPRDLFKKKTLGQDSFGTWRPPVCNHNKIHQNFELPEESQKESYASNLSSDFQFLLSPLGDLLAIYERLCSPFHPP